MTKSNKEKSIKKHNEKAKHGELEGHVPHPDHDNQPKKEDGTKDHPKCGWEGEMPSKDGGDSEKDFLNKPPYNWTSDVFKVKYSNSCFCGNLSFEYAAEPLDAKFCHCHSCQRLHGAPLQHAVIFSKTSVRLKSNKDNSLDYFSNEKKTSVHHVPCKIACTNCRSPLFDEGRNTVIAYPGTFDFPEDLGKPIPDSFKATSHIFYGERSLDINDGLPKYEGHKGSSKLIPEESEAHEEGRLRNRKIPKTNGDHK